MAVILKNKSKRMQIFELPHDVVCEGEGDGCLCTDTTLVIPFLNKATGERGMKHIDKTLNDSVHIAVGESSRPLPDSVVSVKSIKAAIGRKEIEATTAPASAPTVTATASA